MIKFVAIVFILYVSGAQAAGYLVYNPQETLSRQLKKNFGASEVFTPNEKALLSGSHVQTNVLKLELDAKELQAVKSLVESYSETLLQSNPSQELYSLPDPYESMQWGLKNNGDDLVEWESDIDVVTTTGVPGEDVGANSLEEKQGQKIRVAVIDSGVDVNHPDLKGQILVKENECQAMREYNNCLNTNPDRDFCHEKFATADSDGNGYPMDCNGWNLGAADIPGAKVSGGPKIFDGDGHGTHVAGIIGAKRNKEGTVGVIQNVEIIPVQVGITSQRAGPDGPKKEAPTDKIAKGILYAIEAGAQVINLSLGWRFDQDSILMRQMIELALSKDILVVAAAGNDSHDGPVYPCSYEGVVCVASHTVNGSLSEFSNYGAHVDIAAPGAKILSSWPANKRSRFFTQEDAYEYMSGTSQAAPHVSALLARLLNLGFSPSEALVKLLKGSRPFSADEGKLLRNGKADLKLAASSDTGAFLYPANKSAALVKWEESSADRSFILKLDNLGAKSTNTVVEIESVPVRGEAVEVTTKRLNLGTVESRARIQKRIHFKAPFKTHGEFLFRVKIESDQENKSYFLQAKAVNIVDGASLRAGQANFDIAGANALEDTAMNKFENFTAEPGIDLLAVKTVNQKTFLSLLKQKGANYAQYEWQRIPVDSPVPLKLSKVDLEQDGTAEYVVTMVSLKDKERKTKFFVFDSEFKPKPILISPKNTYDNELAVMPGGFKWALRRGRMVPAWIGVGQRPENERPAPGPWEKPRTELKINRLYLLLPEGLKTIPFAGEEEIPLHLLYQSEESKKLGRITLVTGDSFGFYKKYSTYQYLNGLEKINQFELFPYVDLLNVKPLPMTNAAGDNAFFAESSLNGARVVGLDIADGKAQVSKKRITPFSKQEKVRRVLSFDGENAIYQTNYHLAYGDSKLPAKTGLRRIKHEILQSQSALYLRSSLSPGLTGELINISDTGELRSDSRWTMLGVNDCSEIGFAKEGAIESLVFACSGKSSGKPKIIQFQLTR